MHTLIVVLHIVVSVALILVILLQTGKGSDIGAVFGGGSSQTLFGSTGPTSFLSKITAGAAIVFMLTSLFLAYFSGRAPSSSISAGASSARASSRVGRAGSLIGGLHGCVGPASAPP